MTNAGGRTWASLARTVIAHVYWLDLLLVVIPIWGVMTSFFPPIRSTVGLILSTAIFTTTRSFRLLGGSNTWIMFVLRWWIAPLVLWAFVVGWRGLRSFAVLLAVLHVIRQVAVEAFRPDATKNAGLRIMMVGDSFAPKIDGVATRTGKAAQILPAMGHSLHVLTSTRSEPLFGVPCTQLPGIRPKFYPQVCLTLPSLDVLRALYDFRPHVVHLWDENFVNPVVQLVCAFLAIPTIWSHHTRVDIICEKYWPEIHAQLGPALTSIGIHRAGIKLIQRYVGSLADEHLVVGKDMFEQLRSARCHNIHFWDVGCDTDLFRPERRSEDCAEGSLRWRMTGGKPHLNLVVHVGRLCVEKGIAIIPDLLDRFNGPENDRQTVVFCVIGDGPFKAPLEELCCGKNLVTLGPIPHSELLAECVATADLFYSPSCCETLGQVFLEAMASGTPVVGAGICGVLEAFSHEREGFHCVPNSVASSVDCIRRALAVRRLASPLARANSAAIRRGRMSAATAAVTRADSSALAAPDNDLPPPNSSSSVFSDAPPPVPAAAAPLAAETLASSAASMADSPVDTACYEHMLDRARARAELRSWRRSMEEALEAYGRAIARNQAVAFAHVITR